MGEMLQIETWWVVTLQACAAVVALGGAVGVLVKLYGWVRKPSASNAASIEQMMEFLGSDKRRIEALERRQDEQEQESKLMLKALMQIMSHEIDGNHKAQLAAVRDEVQDFLIER